MTQRLINRLLLFIAPVLLLSIPSINQWYYSTEDIGWGDIFILVYVFSLLTWVILELIKNYNFLKNRNEESNFKKLITPNKVEENNSFFNLRIINNENSLTVFNKHEFDMFYNKQKELLDISGVFKNKRYSLYDIENVVFEFSQYNLLTFWHNFGQSNWECLFFIKLKKTNRLVLITKMTSNRDNLKESGDYQSLDTNKYIYSKGLEIINIISSALNTKYVIINQVKSGEHYKKVTEESSNYKLYK